MSVGSVSFELGNGRHKNFKDKKMYSGNMNVLLNFSPSGNLFQFNVYTDIVTDWRVTFVACSYLCSERANGFTSIMHASNLY